jgi:hypothetical protein
VFLKKSAEKCILNYFSVLSRDQNVKNTIGAESASLVFKVRVFAFNFGAGDQAAGAVCRALTREPMSAPHFESGALARAASFARSSSLRTLRAQSTKTRRFSFFQIKPLFSLKRSKKSRKKIIFTF